MLRKLGMALAAGVLVAGCGAVPTGNAPSAVTSEYSPPTTSSAPETPTTSSTSSTSIAVPVTTPPTTVAKPKPAPKTQTAPRATTPQADLPDQAAPGLVDCGTDYYRNSSGNCVHRPDSNPSGATALCNDGTYSYSQHRSGTCSHHGGVKQWL